MTIEQQVHDYRHEELQSAHFWNVWTADLPIPRKIYDMASGIGAYCEYIVPADEYLGIEIDEDRVRQARFHYPCKKFLEADCTATGLDNYSADAIISCETFEHIGDYKAYLNEMYRLLKPGGLLSFSTPSTNLYCYPSYFLRVLLFSRPAPLKVMFHWLSDWNTAVNHHPSTTKTDIIAAIESAGFKVKSYRTVLSFYEHHYVYRLMKLWEMIQPENKAREWLCFKWMRLHSWLVRKYNFLGTRHVITAEKP